MGKPHGNSRLAKIGRPVPKRKHRGGAPKGNRNARKHGRYSAEFLELRARVRAFRRRVKATMAFLESAHHARIAASLPRVTGK